MEIGFSKQLDDAIVEISKLPGIGRRTALRLALHLLKTDPHEVALRHHTELDVIEVHQKALAGTLCTLNKGDAIHWRRKNGTGAQGTLSCQNIANRL